MNNPYLTSEEIRQVFHETYLIENHGFLDEDLQKLANAFIMRASTNIAKTERQMCIRFVKSLNTRVAEALEEHRGNL